MADWDVETKLVPTTTEEYRELRHLPEVVAQITNLAQKLVDSVGHPNDFGVLVQNDSNTQRARAFAKPTTWKGIRLEQAESVLLKAAGSGGHQEINTAAPSNLLDLGTREGEFELGPGGTVK